MPRPAVVCIVFLALACGSLEDRADRHFAAARWSEARDAYLELVEQDPGDAELRFKLGETHWKLAEFDRALDAYREAVRLDPSRVGWRAMLARAAFVAGHYDEAREQVRQLLELDPTGIDTRILSARDRMVRGEFGRALADLEDVLERDAENAEALLLRAHALVRQQRYADAETTARTLVRVDPSVASHSLLAAIQWHTGRPDEALASLRTAAGLAVGDEPRLRVRLALANLHLNRGETDAAVEELRELRREMPDDPRPLVLLANVYASHGDRDRAIEILEAHALAHPSDVGARLLLAQFHQRLGNAEEALASVDRALTLDPRSNEARLMRAEYLMESDPRQPSAEREARALLSAVLADAPDSPDARFVEAKFLLEDGEVDEAASRLEQVLRVRPSAPAHYLLGTILLQRAQFDRAQAELLAALDLDATHALAREHLAALHLATARPDRAAQQARIALRLDPGNPRVRTILARALGQLGQPDEARSVLRELTLEPPGSGVSPWLAAVEAYRSLGARDEAVELLLALLDETPGQPDAIRLLHALDPEAADARLADSIRTRPDSAELYELRAELRLADPNRTSQGLARAEADLNRAVELDPSRAAAHLLLGQLYERRGRTEDAIASYQRAAAADGSFAEPLFRLGNLYERSSRNAEAIASYEKVLELDDDHPLAMNNLAWLLATELDPGPDLDRALALARGARKLRPDDPNVTDTLGWVLHRRDDSSAAIPLFQEALRQLPEGPGRAAVRYHLALSYERSGDRDNAMAQLELCLEEANEFPQRPEVEAALARLRGTS